ncbi:ankyrin repeat protein, putative [Trichomonas vaginalis G3]|uniref:Ankyrin repeat protein, putative n=1 Tax=Trichomonas vaginalis (strain ATCC PRA-98 / G3) TaxID=412133 RepID=A2E305_TRIV3|nr:ankyrin repeat protein, putative [Trichomonas vaginalis G3]|eukprot:XP_001325164.1 ankyrin repeat protein [Trichomonas vaginalis G3]
MTACQQNNKNMAILLISYGANVNEEDNDRNTALNYAVKYSYLELCDILISFGADVRKINEYRSPFNFKGLQNYGEIQDFLISKRYPGPKK